MTDIGPTTPADDAPGAGNWTAVSFRDLRFMYDTSMMQGRNQTPLSAMAYVDANGRVVRMEMGGHVQK